ncbi:3 beta-hydroxysteroid dehydrogenase/Delta 5--_4-isomerase [Planctomycetes bacterium CA13]|uniref:3 beta-hydroxysteroid dehydrogenase/Delta 5-->4-isomerase n=1 Tax=Novipirellula herctigrandis TaxID=2527986 RepID=A0A5C5Z140_9BACT|nr:3 beta-hydroxysteroid dehydrogenase/Delta 5-->4-isomerase [Planctomycetes bacterium CA13]
MSKETVLLTGISGYIGLHCAKKLLNNGFEVRGSVRNTAKGKKVHETLAAASVDTTNLTTVELNLTSDKGWDEATKGCDYVMHVASPYVIADPKSEDEVIAPAVDGTLRALRAAKKSGVKRVVLTSSALAMMGSMKTGTFGPQDWTDTDSKQISTYTKSKTLAEKAAWDFVAKQSADSVMEMVSVNPGAVFGPPIGTDISGQSMTMIDKMLRGKMPMVGDVSMPMVDVRDLAQLHVQALTNSNAAGKRIIGAAAKPNRIVKIAEILRSKGYKGPKARVAPNFLLRIMSLFDAEAKGMVGLLGTNVQADNSETRELFEWNPRPFSESVLDTAAAIEAISA